MYKSYRKFYGISALVALFLLFLFFLFRFDWFALAGNYLRCRNAALNIEKYPSGANLFLTYAKLLKWRNSLVNSQKIEKKCRTDIIPGLKIYYSNANDLVNIFDEIFLSKVYDFQSKKEDPFIIDCGSNIGMSIIFFKLLYSKSKILAFEPSKCNFNILKKNILKNRLDSIELNHKALSNHSGSSYIYNSGTARGSLIVKQSGNQEQINTICLSNYINKEVDLLKLDIEGSEGIVIKELAEKDKLRFIKEIIMEYHYFMNEKNNLSKLLKIFEKNNFVYHIGGGNFSPFDKNKAYDVCMIRAYNKKL